MVYADFTPFLKYPRTDKNIHECSRTKRTDNTSLTLTIGEESFPINLETSDTRTCARSEWFQQPMLFCARGERTRRRCAICHPVEDGRRREDEQSLPVGSIKEMLVDKPIYTRYKSEYNSKLFYLFM